MSRCLLLSARARVGACVIVVALALSCAAPPVAAAPTVWIAPSLERIPPDAPAGTLTQGHLYAARGEYESFQIVVGASPVALTTVNLLAPDLVGPTGTIAKANLTLYREHFVYIYDSSPDWRGRNRPLPPGWYPDALVPFVDPLTGQDLVGARYDAVPFSLDPNRTQPIWVDVYVPRSTPAGDYQGVFTVTSDQGESAIALLLTVWGFNLPHQPYLKSCFGTEDWYRTKADELLRHRLMPRHIELPDERPFMDARGLNCINAGFWSGADGRSCNMNPAPSPEDFVAAAARHQSDLFLYAYTADEIGACSGIYTAMREWARNMHQSRIRNLVTMPPVPELYDDGSGTGRSAVDIWVMLPKMYDASRSRVAYVLDKGDQAWSYNCLVQDDYSPKWEVDFAPINFRLQPGFINQSLSLTGLLYWRVDVWTADPWTDVEVPVEGDLFPGEGLLLYPGAAVGLPGQVVPSMRLKYLRDGVDDYDYLQLLRNQGQEAWALNVARSVGPDWANWTRDPNALEAARLQLGEMLHSLTAGGHTLSAAAFATPAVVATSGTVALTAAAADSQDHAITSWSWSDGGAGGTFLPSAAAQNPVYTAPASTGGADLLVALTVTATCASGADRDGALIAVVPAGNWGFRDLPPDYWALPSIRACLGAGIVAGYDDGTYRPTVQVTRDQMAVFIARALAGGDAGVPSGPALATFPDVPKAHWAYRYIEYVVGRNVAQGFPEGDYRPSLAVDRGQMAVFIARSIADPTGEAGLADYTPPSEPTFRDVKANHWAYKHIEYIVAQGVATGYDNGTYRPLATCTRDQMAVFIARAFDLA
jgi:hypothetical protein